jgi:alanine-glyoxylate transaminase/serine-glyoxylate transaminase/serine-pyruvate transaminase
VIEAEWGQGVPIDQFAQVLANDKGHEIKVLLVTQNETATGVENDVTKVREAMTQSNHSDLLGVDSVSTIAPVVLQMDEWGVDLP